MNSQERILLQDLISQNDTTEQTDLIRQLQHSYVIRSQVKRIIELKETFKDESKLHEEASFHCDFLYRYYTDIYNKVRKDEIDLDILFKMLDALTEIEESKLDQHEASYKVGQYLKEIYIDSALRKANKLNEEHKDDEKEYRDSDFDINWKEYKNNNKL